MYRALLTRNDRVVNDNMDASKHVPGVPSLQSLPYSRVVCCYYTSTTYNVLDFIEYPGDDLNAEFSNLGINGVRHDGLFVFLDISLIFGHLLSVKQLQDDLIELEVQGVRQLDSNINTTSDGATPIVLTNILIPTLADNGCYTQTNALIAGNPAIDAVPAQNCTVRQKDTFLILLWEGK